MALTLYTRTYTYTSKDNTNCSSSNPRCTVARSTFKVSGSTKKMGLITKIVFTHYHSAKGHIDASLYGKITMWNGATYNSNTVTKEINANVPLFTNTFTFNNLNVTGATQGAEWSKIQVYGSGSGLYWRATSSQPMKVVFYFYAAEELFDGAEAPNVLLGNDGQSLKIDFADSSSFDSDLSAKSIFGEYIKNYSRPAISIGYQLDQSKKDGTDEYKFKGIFAKHTLQLSLGREFNDLIYENTIQDVTGSNLYQTRPAEIEGTGPGGDTILYSVVEFDVDSFTFESLTGSETVFYKYTIVDAADNTVVYRPSTEADAFEEGETFRVVENGTTKEYIASNAISFTALNYTEPSLNSFEAFKYQREESTGTRFVKSITGQFLGANYSLSMYTPNGENEMVLTITSTIDGTDFSSSKTYLSQSVNVDEWASYLENATDNTDSSLLFGNTVFNPKSEYTLTIVLSDKITSVISELIVSKASAFFNVEKNGVAVGMLSTSTSSEKKFEVAEDYKTILNGGLGGFEGSFSTSANGCVMGGSIQYGNIYCQNIPNGGYKDYAVTFRKPFKEVPFIMVCLRTQSVGKMGNCTVVVQDSSQTKTGFNVRGYVTSNGPFSPIVSWLAIGDVDLES